MCKKSDTPDSEQINSSDEHLSPLDTGTVVCNRYTIVDILSRQTDRIVYAATEDAYLRWCPSCEALMRLEVDDEFCDECGAELSPGRYRLTEWSTEQGPLGLNDFVQTKVTHTGWQSPQDWFIWEGHRYMVQEDLDGEILETIRASVTLDDALIWGITLAEALYTLHEYGFAGLQLNPEDLIVTGSRQIKLVNWDAFAVYPADPPFADHIWIDARQQDLKQLASILTVLIDDEGDDDAGNEAEIDPVLQTILSDMTTGEYTDALTVADDLKTRLHGVETVDIPEAELAQEVTLQYGVGSWSDVGRVRLLNEDSLLSLDLSVIRNSQLETMGFYVVADGVGGHDCGEVASRIAVGAMAHTLANMLVQPALEHVVNMPDKDTYTNMLEDAVRAANKAIAAERLVHEADNMSTTLTAALVIGSFAYVANVGDSRTYLFRQNKLTPLTVDHSLVARLVAIGMIGPDEVYTHPQRSAIYRALGDEQDFQVDTFFQPLLPEDQLVLCSDGLWEMVHDPEMETILANALSPQDACDTLVSRANLHGGEDNISVIVVQAVERH